MIATLLAGVVLLHGFAMAGAPVRVFTQSAYAVGPDGRELPRVLIDPEADGGLSEAAYPLGRGRRLCVRTDLPASRLGGLDDLAARVARGYEHVEAATGRRVAGGVLLYLVDRPVPPPAYTFRAELSGIENWVQVRVVLIGAGDALWGPAEAPQLREFLLDTLPHELGHGLIDAAPTVRQDHDGGAPTGTRWFVDGVCESLAKGFAAREDRAAARSLLARRHVDEVLDRPGVRGRLLSWHSGSELSWELESDLYGAAFLLTEAWLEARPLDALLADLAATGGDHDGGALLDRLRADTGLPLAAILDRAAGLGRALLAPPPRQVTLLRRKGNGPPPGGPFPRPIDLAISDRD